MATNLAIDPELLNKALEVGGEKDQESDRQPRLAGVHRAPRAGTALGSFWQIVLGRQL